MVERSSCFKYIGINISKDLSWSHHKGVITKAARQWFFFFQRLRWFHIDFKNCNGLHYKALKSGHMSRTELTAIQHLQKVLDSRFFLPWILHAFAIIQAVQDHPYPHKQFQEQFQVIRLLNC